MLNEVGLAGQPVIVNVTNIRPEEKEIYRQLWETKEYRVVAPGQHYALEFLKQAQPKPGSEVIDIGCGTGRGGILLATLGNMKVTFLDFTNNCLDKNIKEEIEKQPSTLSFVEADLTKKLPVIAQYGYCFPAKTIISGNKFIEDISIDETVLDKHNKKQKVKKIFKRLYTGDVTRLNIDCLPDNIITNGHEIFVSKVNRIHRKSMYGAKKSVYEYVASAPVLKKVEDVQPGDWVSIPRISESNSHMIEFLLNGGGRGRMQTKKTIKHEIDEGIAWLLGLYVAEGHVSKGRIVFSLNANETSLAERAILEFKRLGVSAHISQPPSIKQMNGLHVVADAKPLAELIDKWCGHGAGKKCVPSVITYSSESVVRSFLMGLVDGDGCLRKNKNNYTYFSFTTISKQLAFDVLALLHKLGIYASLPNPRSARKALIRGRLCDCKECYTVLWSKRSWDNNNDIADRTPYGRSKFIGNSVYLRINKVSQEKVVDLPVFNIHTEDETYGVPFTVHNCTDVMEHIPEKDVDAVLNNCLLACRHVFFNISTVPDVSGKLVGHPLHLSVHPYEWWLNKFVERECVIHYAKNENNAAQFYVTAWTSGKAIVDSGVVNVSEDIIRANIKFNNAQDWLPVQPYPTNDTEVMILGGGWSLNEHIDKIRELQDKGVKIITLNGTYQWAIEHELKIGAQVIIDARPFNARFAKPVLDGVKYFIASQCDPSVFEGLPKDRTFIWHINQNLVSDILKDTNKQFYPVPGGSTALLRAIPLFRMLGFKKFYLFGCDSCLSPNNEHHAYPQPENDSEIILPMTLNPSGRVFYGHSWMLSQAQEFMDLLEFLGDEFELEVYGDGLLNHILQTVADLADEENKITIKEK